jgi:hypothetical protein
VTKKGRRNQCIRPHYPAIAPYIERSNDEALLSPRVRRQHKTERASLEGFVAIYVWPSLDF